MFCLKQDCQTRLQNIFSLTLGSLEMEMAPRPELKLNSLSLNPVQASLAVLERVLLALGAKKVSFDSSPIYSLLLLAIVLLRAILH